MRKPDLFEEMRMFVQHHPQVTADACVDMVTKMPPER